MPEARIAVGHGQMPEDQLEQTMLGFAEGEFDVLVCTTIIESGLDIPNANTLIVNSAHRFGLAQLYQLRGRVGRSASRAYAYLLYAKDMSARARSPRSGCKTIFEATELGAGFRIAMKDLEIRGAGNLLGAEQSGHIAAVGFDLYTKLLAEQVELLKARHDGSAALAVRARLAVARSAAQRVHPARVRRSTIRCACGCTSASRRSTTTRSWRAWSPRSRIASARCPSRRSTWCT